QHDDRACPQVPDLRVAAVARPSKSDKRSVRGQLGDGPPCLKRVLGDKRGGRKLGQDRRTAERAGWTRLRVPLRIGAVTTKPEAKRYATLRPTVGADDPDVGRLTARDRDPSTVGRPCWWRKGDVRQAGIDLAKTGAVAVDGEGAEMICDTRADG